MTAALSIAPFDALAMSDYAPGARVVEHLLRRMGVTLAPAPALVLWSEVQALLQAGSGSYAVEEALESRRGSLDTASREEVQDAMGQVLVGRPWPANMDDQPDQEVFLTALGAALGARGAQGFDSAATAA